MGYRQVQDSCGLSDRDTIIYHIAQQQCSVSSVPLQQAFERYRQRTKDYLQENSGLAHQMICNMLSELYKPGNEEWLKFTTKAMVHFGKDEVEQVITEIKDKPSDYSMLVAKVGIEAARLIASGQLNDLITDLQSKSCPNSTPYRSTYELPGYNLTVDAAKAVINQPIVIPPFISADYPMGAAVSYLNSAASALYRATNDPAHPARVLEESSVYWTWPSSCTSLWPRKQYVVGQDITAVQAIRTAWAGLQDAEDRSATVGRFCGTLGVALLAVKFISLFTGPVGIAIAEAVYQGEGVACVVGEALSLGLTYGKQQKMTFALTEYTGIWPNALSEAYRAWTDIRSDLERSFTVDPGSCKASNWDIPGLCVENVSLPAGSYYGLGTAKVTVKNVGDYSDAATVILEIHVGNPSGAHRAIAYKAGQTPYLPPKQTGELSLSFTAPLQDGMNGYSKWYVYCYLLSGNGVISKTVEFDKNSDCIPPAGKGVMSSTFESLDVLTGRLGSFGSHDTTYVPLPQTRALALTLTWPFDNLDLHVYDAGGRHVGWNSSLQTVDLEIPGSSYWAPGANPKIIRLSDLSTGPFVVRVDADSLNDSLDFNVTATERPAMPAELAAYPTSIQLGGFIGDTVFATIALTEVNGQQPVTGLSLTASILVSPDGDSIPSAAISFPMPPSTLLADSTVALRGSIFIPPSTDTAVYTGTITLSSDAGASQVVLVLKVALPYQRGDMDVNDVFNVLDVVGMINYVFRGAETPYPDFIADVNCDGVPNVLDVVRLIEFVFRGEAQPVCP